MTGYILWVTLVLFLLTVVTRTLPFLFASKLAGNEKMKRVGKQLAAYIMMLLVIYQINPASFTSHPFGWPHLVSLAIVVVIHLLFHKPLLSMLVGTISFIFFIQI